MAGPDESHDLASWLDHFTLRVLADALTEATAGYWRRRAAMFDDAAPRADEYRGQSTEADLSDAWRRCASVAAACRHRADLVDAEPEVPPEVVAEVESVLRGLAQVRAAEGVAA